MRKFINNLRQKPEEERRQMLHFFTILVAVVVFLLWAYSLQNSFSSSDFKEGVARDLSEFESLKSNVVDSYNGMRGAVSEPNNENAE